MFSRKPWYCLAIVVLMFAAIASETTAQPARPSQQIIKNRAPLPANAFVPLPLTSVKPKGWLRSQLEIQANGLSGHVDEFWPDLGPNSAWLGGDGEGWERGPYFADGLLPLAYLLDDAKLITKAQKWVEWTLTHQRPDGGIGPDKNKDWWPNMVMLKVLTQHYEATGDARVIPLMQKYFKYHAAHLNERPLNSWASYRWGEELLSVLWLYNRTGDAELLKLASDLNRQGFDWKKRFSTFIFTEKMTQPIIDTRADVPGAPQEAMAAHGVNNAMALKYNTLWSLISGDASDRNAIYQMYRMLDEYHGMPNGMFSADEHLGGTNPSQGVEVCAVVESMFSLEHLISVLGDPLLGDRLERIAYNAMPAPFSPDYWAHQYDQQANQVLVNIAKRDWSTNSPESNVFGLEPHFGCCTANMHQGWPKFAANLWMATSDDGLVAVAYAPSEVRTTVRGGVPVQIVEETEYPFRDQIRITVNPASVVTFPLKLRIPAWVQQPVVKVNGRVVRGLKAGTFYTIERKWKQGDRVELQFPMTARATRWHAGSVAVERGPLVFALKIGEDWRKLEKGMHRPAPAPAADWEVHPTTPWNVGLLLDPDRLATSVRVVEKPVGKNPFTSEGAPLELYVKGQILPEWRLVNGSAGPMPVDPARSDAPEQEFVLIPYGAAKLRITAFPVVSGD